MLLFNFLNPKPFARPAGHKSNINSSQSKIHSSGPHDSQETVRASDFFSFHGMGEALSPITLEQSGRIHFGGTDWPAQLIPNRAEHQTTFIPEGTMVQVVGRQGITLLVAVA